MQNILPSIHLLEIFMPVADREDFLVGMLEEVKKIDFYKGIELPVIFQKENIAKVRRIAREKSYQITEWASPDIIKRGYNLSSTDRELRGQSVGYAVELMKIAAEAGTAIVGLPSGDDRILRQRGGFCHVGGKTPPAAHHRQKGGLGRQKCLCLPLCGGWRGGFSPC